MALSTVYVSIGLTEHTDRGAPVCMCVCTSVQDTVDEAH